MFCSYYSYRLEIDPIDSPRWVPCHWPLHHCLINEAATCDRYNMLQHVRPIRTIITYNHQNHHNQPKSLFVDLRKKNKGFSAPRADHQVHQRASNPEVPSSGIFCVCWFHNDTISHNIFIWKLMPDTVVNMLSDLLSKRKSLRDCAALRSKPEASGASPARSERSLEQINVIHRKDWLPSGHQTWILTNHRV